MTDDTAGRSWYAGSGAEWVLFWDGGGGLDEQVSLCRVCGCLDSYKKDEWRGYAVVLAVLCAEELV